MKWIARALCAGAVLLAPARAPAQVPDQQDDFWQGEVDAAERSLLAGSLAEAEAAFEDIVAAGEEEPEGDRPKAAEVRQARQGLLRVELIQGQYEEVRAAITALPEVERSDRGFRVLAAVAAQRVGEYELAGNLWQAVLDANPGDAEAGYWRGWLLRETGRRDRAREIWRATATAVARRDAASALELAYAGRCLIELGGRANLEDASALLARSVEAAPERPEARTAFGLLQHRVYNEASGYPSGERALLKVLENNGEYEPALVGLYRLRRSNFQLDPAKTEGFLRRALIINPRSVPALNERASVLLRDRRFDVAARVLDSSLEVNPNDKRTLAHRSAAALLLNQPREAEGFRKRALAIDPTYADLDRIIGDHLVALYRFADAVPYYRQALALRDDAVAALDGLAKALIYTGRGEDAVSVLHQAAELQPGVVNPWRNNALAVEDLLSSEYTIVSEEGFRFRIHLDDVGVLSEYLLPMHLRAKKVLGAKYGLVPTEDVTVEVFHTWADFSVRTIGFRGFSALGACFGHLITLVSPSDDLLRRQDFMWAATVWHEYTHVLTLGLSRHRVPRWLTEGFSVYEERQRNRAWERGMDRELFDAYHNGQVVPLLQLNSLFRGPRILFGYYQGGLIVDYLSREFGFAKVIELLRGYGEDRATAEMFESIFGVTTAEFDRKFLEFVRDEKLRGLELEPRAAPERVQRLLTQIVRDPDDLQARVDLGWAYCQRNDAIDAANQLRVVLNADPDHARGQLLHAELLRQRKAVAEAIAAYRKGFAGGADDFDSRVRFGKLLEATGDIDGAIDQYQRAKACWPGCTDQAVAPNLMLARLLRKHDREQEAMMELKAFVSLTGRAFQPRLELAAMEKKLGNREAEVAMLEQANWIDPFMRELHVRLGEGYAALQRYPDAAREYRVALAVPQKIDRANLDKPAAEVPDPDSAQEREWRAEMCLRLARLHRRMGQDDQAFLYLDRTVVEAGGGDAAAQAERLRESWRE